MLGGHRRTGGGCIPEELPPTEFVVIATPWLTGGLSLLVLVCGTFSSQAADRPNILFMIADDCTFRDIGCYGGQAYTPNIDRLAGEGMQFSRCFQAAPMCSPTRHHIYTGLYPVKSGAYPNHTYVDTGTQSVVQYLKPLGYRVAQSGKTHVAPWQIFNWKRLGKGQNPDFKLVDNFLGDCQKAGKPFCLFLCSNEPHSPWNKGDPSRYPPNEIKLPPYLVDTPETRDGMSRYLAEITYYDSQVGQAMELLNKHDCVEETLVIVVSEQGSSMPFAKWTCYDSGLQSACLIRWPDHVEAGSKNPAMIEYVDFLPTMIEVAGGEVPEILDGTSLIRVLEGETKHKSYVFGEHTTRGIINGSNHYGIRSVRSEKYKYIWNFTPEEKFQNVCMKSREFQSWIAAAKQGHSHAAELVRRYQYRPEIELYDVEADPFEMNNLADQPGYDAVKKELRLQLDRWMKHCGDEGQATELRALERTKNGQKKSN